MVCFVDNVLIKDKKIGAAGEEIRVEKSFEKKSCKNHEKSSIFRRFFRNGRFLVDFSALAIHAPGRRVRVARGVDLSAIKEKYRRFFSVFSAFSPGFFWPLDFFCF